MYTFSLEQRTTLDGSLPIDTNSENMVHTSMDGFLASVERRAYIIGLASCHDQQVALDIVQDAMFSMVKSYSKKPPEQWPALFFGVLNNRITDQHRKRGFGRLKQWFGDSHTHDEPVTEAVDQLKADEFGPERLTASLELSAVIEDALQNLSFKQQQALILRLWQGLSVKETASAMGVSEGSVKTHLSRAVHVMREHLEEFKPK